MEKNNNVAENLKKLRQTLGKNQTQMAEEFGIHQGSYSGIERGVSTVTTRQLQILGDRYGVNLNWLICGVGKMFLEDDSSEEDVKDKIATMENEIAAIRKLLKGRR